MRAGQFITAPVELPPDPGEVEIPIAALVEDGQESDRLHPARPAPARLRRCGA